MSAQVHHGDCLDVLRAMAERGETVHACVTDPPYHLTAGKKGGTGEASVNLASPYGRSRITTGFMGKRWDGGDVAFRAETWAAVADVLPPGGHVLAFGGTRTYHRLVCAIEDAGFEIRDALFYLYGTGFPKSHNLDKLRGDVICGCPASNDLLRGLLETTHDSGGLGKAGGPADVLAPMQRGASRGRVGDAWAQGSGGTENAASAEVRGGQSGLEGRGDAPKAARELCLGALSPVSAGSALHGAGGRLCDGTSIGDGAVGGAAAAADGSSAPRGSQPTEQRPLQSPALALQPEPQDGGAWPTCRRCGKPIVPHGLGTALKPAVEPIVLARKPLAGTVAANVLAHGTGAINVDACRVQGSFQSGWSKSGIKASENVAMAGANYERSPKPDNHLGRWPANVLHDGSPDVLQAFAAFGEAPGQQAPVRPNSGTGQKTKGILGTFATNSDCSPRNDTGTAARFFYCAKADATDRNGSRHPTVKPLDLMRWLVRLVTPPGGTVLDPFAGTGTTGEAALREGFRAVLIERDAEYVADINRRLARMRGGDTPLLASAAQ